MIDFKKNNIVNALCVTCAICLLEGQPNKRKEATYYSLEDITFGANTLANINGLSLSKEEVKYILECDAHVGTFAIQIIDNVATYRLNIYSMW